MTPNVNWVLLYHARWISCLCVAQPWLALRGVDLASGVQTGVALQLALEVKHASFSREIVCAVALMIRVV